MKLTHLSRTVPVALLILLWIVASSFTQNLTVRQIMSEPSIAGMRVDGEKLSPDGTKVVFLWNAEGKMPRDLYLVPTSGGSPVKILSPSDLPPPSRPPEKENKLDYGLELRDQFIKARENQFGNFEWSPDSKRLVTSYGGDLYVLSLDGSTNEQMESSWRAFEAAFRRRSNLLPEIVKAVQADGVNETQLFAELTASNLTVLKAMQATSHDERTVALAKSADTDKKFLILDQFPESYPQLRRNTKLMDLLNEAAGVADRLNVAVADYKRYIGHSTIRRLTRTQTPETAARFLGNGRILFSQSGNLFILDLSNSLLTQISREGNAAAFVSVINPTPNKPGTLIAYVVSDSSKNKALVVPNYLDEFAAAATIRRGWSEQKVVVAPADGSRETPFEIKLPKPEGVSSIRRMVWAADNSSLIVDRIDKDTKRRTLFYIYDVGSKGEKIIPIIEETDDKWQASLSAIFEPNPKDSGELFFGSEKDGFNHLYLARLEKATAEPNPTGVIRQENPSDSGYSGKVTLIQLTNGNWQVEWAKWILRGDQIIFLSTRKGAAERSIQSIAHLNGHYYTLGIEGDGMVASPQLSEQSSLPTLIYSTSAWNRPHDLYSMVVCPGCPDSKGPLRLTATVPSAFSARKWNEPKFVEIPSRDGKKIPAKIYFPTGFNPTAKQKYPMVIFVHGAGYLQNVINGWNNYYREFMFNDLLAKSGYVVLDIDYRGSAGYGRDWRTDVYDFLGGKDYDDHIDSIDHMVANYNVNRSKIGVYGGSYGGFMAGMLAMRAPDKIAAAAALRPVFDWKNYYASSPGYTAQRLGFPDKNPEAYKRSSPITYADKLERPLLILHGMADDNVHVQDSVQLMEKLIRLGKSQYVEAMLYPSENHGFVRPESWTDEYERILAFFEKHLK